MMQLPAFASEKYVQGLRQGTVDIHREIEERIGEWQGASRPLERVDRVFVVSGWPGVGKSWLLCWVGERFDGIYIDLENRREYSTPHAFVNRWRDEMGRRTGPSLYCIDHVPPSNSLDDTLALFEEKILRPGLDEQDGFMIFAVRDRESWCWVEIPHPSPQDLSCFNQSGVGRLLNKWGCRRRDRWQEIFWYGNGHPYLTYLLRDACQREGNYGAGMRKFLQYWQDRIGIRDTQERERLMRVARPLSLVDDLGDTAWVRRALEADRCKESPQSALNVLKNAWWAEGRPVGRGNRYVTCWVEPVCQCIRYLFEIEEPERYRQLREAVRDF